MSDLHSIRQGRGKPLLLIHGLGGSWRTWTPVLQQLTAEREVIAIDLPGHGASRGRRDSGTFVGLANSVETFVEEAGLGDADIAGTSLGARLALDLARRGIGKRVVALDPGGFWHGWERRFFKVTISASVRLLRGLGPKLPALSRNRASRTALLAQLSARPWALDPELVAAELEGFATTPTLDALVRDLATGPMQRGPAAPGVGPVVIGWGRHDRLCLPGQAKRAKAVFPSARLHWFAHSGHFPLWDEPEATVQLILARD